jgi:DNA-binding beta-propeller fold protein YncE
MRRSVILLAIVLGAALALVHAQTPAPVRLFFLDLGSGGRVVSANDDGTDVKVVSRSRATGPDGIAMDPSGTRLYWTTMGSVNANDGTIERADLDGGNGTTIVPSGGTFTPKQLKIDAVHGKLYWSDREGMRVMRANLDGSNVETLVETALGDEARRDARNWCVGIALDVARGKVYWTQKGSGGNGRIFRTNLDMPKGQTAAHRSDIETLFDALPEPIDMDVDLSTRLLYWTDRGDPPQGNTVNRAPMDPPAGVDPRTRTDVQVLFGGLREGIGIALDVAHGRLFVTDLGGNIHRAGLDGSDHKIILSGQGSLTGIAILQESRQ